LANKFKESSVVGVYDVDCTAGGESLCQKYQVKGYPTIKYFTKKTGKMGADYQGGRDFGSIQKFIENTFKASCDPHTRKGCNAQEERYLDKLQEKTPTEIVEEKKTKETELKDLKKERSVAEREWEERNKKWKSKEVALNKALDILKVLEKSGKKASEKKKPKDDTSEL